MIYIGDSAKLPQDCLLCKRVQFLCKTN